MLEKEIKRSRQAAGPSFTRPSRKAGDGGQVGCVPKEHTIQLKIHRIFFSQRATSCSMKVEVPSTGRTERYDLNGDVTIDGK